MMTLVAVCLLALSLGGGFLEDLTSRELWGPPPMRRLGVGSDSNALIHTVVVVSDLDGDGARDLAVGADLDDLGRGNSVIVVLSPRSGREILRLEGARSDVWTRIEDAGDLDGDGRSELAVYNESEGWRTYSGRTGARLATSVAYPMPSATPAEARQVSLGDWDNDGHPELAELVYDTYPKFFGHTIYAQVVVRSVDSELGRLEFPSPVRAILPCEDLDGDGHNEFLVIGGRSLFVYSRDCFRSRPRG